VRNGTMETVPIHKSRPPGMPRKERRKKTDRRRPRFLDPAGLCSGNVTARIVAVCGKGRPLGGLDWTQTRLEVSEAPAVLAAWPAAGQGNEMHRPPTAGAGQGFSR